MRSIIIGQGRQAYERASSLSLFKHKAGSIGPETKEVMWIKMDRSSDNSKAQSSGQQRLEVELHVLSDGKTLAF